MWQCVLNEVCTTCDGPVKFVHPPSSARAHLYRAEQAGWYGLVLCQDCGTLWVQAPYEPYASYLYLIAWAHSRAFFNIAAGLQDGLIIGRWCDYRIRQAWPTMAEHDRLAVQNHRNRSYGRNPIDEAPDGDDADPLKPFLMIPEFQA